MTTSTLPATKPRLAWLSTERLAYLLLALVPTLVRIMHLGARALAPAEAHTALRAWQQAHGLHPALDAGSPLLFSLQTLSFFVADGSDALARAWPLLAAGALPLTFYLMRQRLGRSTALIAATLVTLSPLVNAFARRSDPTSFALLAAGLALAGWFRWQDEQPHGSALLLSGIALAFLSGPGGFSVLLALAAFLLLAQLENPQQRLRLSARSAQPALILLLAGGAAFLTRFDTLGLSAINLSQWLADFSLAPKHLLFGFIRMAADEPVLSLFGLLAVIWGVRRGGMSRALSIAAGISALLAILHGPDASYSRAVAAFFLTLPTARLLDHWRQQHAFSFRSLEQILLTAVIFLLAFLTVYALMTFAHTSSPQFKLLFLLTDLMGVIVIAIFIWFIGWPEVRNALIISALSLSLLFGAGMAWALAFNHTLPTLARVTPTETLPAMQSLVQTIGDISQHNTGDRHATAIALIPGTPADDVIQWYLRDAAQLDVTPNVNLQDPPPIILAPPQAAPALGDTYAGQSRGLSTDWGLKDIQTLNQAITWFFQRRAPFPPPTHDTIQLWVRLDHLSLNQH